MYSHTTFSGRAVRKLAPFPPLSPFPPLRLYTREASFCCSSPRQHNGTWPKTGSVRFRTVPFRSVRRIKDTDTAQIASARCQTFDKSYLDACIHENRPIAHLKDICDDMTFFVSDV